MDERVLTVTALNEYVKGLVDTDPILRRVAVRGELSNYKVYPSGRRAAWAWWRREACRSICGTGLIS